MIQYQVITLMTTNGQAPFITVFMYLDEVPEGQTRDDLAAIIEEMLHQRIKGVKNEKGVFITPAFPKLIYVLEEDNIHEDYKYFYLTRLAAQSTAKRMDPDYISEKIMKSLKEGNCYTCMGCRSFLTVYKDEAGKYKFYGRFNQGVVTLNLVDIACSSGGAAPRPEPKLKTTTGGIAKVIAVASGKGGVGKSTVTANLAVALRNMGFRVGILDADIYGPSQPKMFGVEGYLPDAVQEEGADHIVPAEPMDIRLMSIGFFIKPTDALLWRGAMAVSALKQMIHQTKWGTLDFLLADLPPGTGDVHLSIIGELKIDSAVIVSTPQQVAVADVVRGVEMFRNENVNIPVAGIIENMAWFTPEELPENRYYLFGKGGARRFAEEHGVDFLGEIPIVQSIMEGADEGRPAAGIDPRVEKWYRGIAEKIVEKVMKSC